MALTQDYVEHRWAGARQQTFLDVFRSGLEALPLNIALIDEGGEIILVNKAWEHFAAANGAHDLVGLGVGLNYFGVCEAQSDDSLVWKALCGIKSVIGGSIPKFELEYPCSSPMQERRFRMTVSPIDLGGASGAIVAHQDISSHRQAQRERVEIDARYRAIFENPALGIAECAWDGGALRVNDAFLRMTGWTQDELSARTFTELTHPEDRDVDLANFEVLRSRAANSFSAEKRLLCANGAHLWVNQTLSAVRGENDEVDCLVILFLDISDRKTHEEKQQTLMRELAHRGKNLFAVIGAIASRSFSGDQTLSEAKIAFEGRLGALSKTYDALNSESLTGLPLLNVFQNELLAYGGRASLSGPEIILEAKAAQTFALIAHELATNAAKYGALSVEAGRLTVTWKVEKQRFLLEWREEGGPRAKPPKRRGFGTTLVQRIAGADLACRPELHYNDTGFCYCLDTPLERVGALDFDSPVRRKLESEIVCSLYDAWRRLRRDGELPGLGEFDWTRFAGSGALTIAKVDGEQVQFAQVGRTLLNELGREICDDDLVSEDPQSLAKVYQRCARKGEPSHEFMRIEFGNDDILTFERLLVPFSATRARGVTHVVGIAIYQGQTRPSDPAST